MEEDSTDENVVVNYGDSGALLSLQSTEDHPYIFYAIRVHDIELWNVKLQEFSKTLELILSTGNLDLAIKLIESKQNELMLSDEAIYAIKKYYLLTQSLFN